MGRYEGLGWPYQCGVGDGGLYVHLGLSYLHSYWHKQREAKSEA